MAYPFGEFFLDDSSSPVVLISGGVGLTPLLAMLNTITRPNGGSIEVEPHRHVSWIQSVSGPEEHAFRGRVEHLARRFPKHVRTAAFYTGLKEAEVEALRRQFVEQGDNNVARLYADRINFSPEGEFDKTLLFREDGMTQYYLCGPLAFMENVERQLKGLGVDEKRIHSEVFVP